METSHLIPLQSNELSGKGVMNVPTIIPDKILMAPGTWNGVSYSSEEIKKAFENTDWSDKDVTSVILDHSDKPLKVSDWVGWVKNPRMEGDNLVGDLELYDEPVLVKLVQAKAKFGISPRVKGTEEEGEFKNYIYENFSIVTNPAVKKAYINLSQERKNCKEVNMVNKDINSEDEVVEDEVKDEDVEEDKEKKVEEKKEPEMSADELLEVTTNSDWTDFVAKMRKQDPKMSLSDIAKAFKEQTKANEALEQLSEEDLAARIKTLTSILAKKKKYPYPADEGMKAKEVKENKEVQELSQKIIAMEKRLNEPSPKSVVSQELSDKTRMVAPHASGVQSFAEYLQNEFLR